MRWGGYCGFDEKNYIEEEIKQEKESFKYIFT
jgi:hypothetical protein